VFVWRITSERNRALDGEEARSSGGRWSSKGVPVIYTSTSLALATLEFLVHADGDRVPDDLLAMRIAIPDDLTADCIGRDELPTDWNAVEEHPFCVRRGDAWAIEARSVALRVPSAVVPEEENVLVNPQHRDARRIEIAHVRLFAPYPRLFEK
jgi:RES domain-containing protein